MIIDMPIWCSVLSLPILFPWNGWSVAWNIKFSLRYPGGCPVSPGGKEYGPIQVVANCCPLLHVSLYV